MIPKDLDFKIRSLKGKLKSEKATILYLVFYLLSYSLILKGHVTWRKSLKFDRKRSELASYSLPFTGCVTLGAILYLLCEMGTIILICFPELLWKSNKIIVSVFISDKIHNESIRFCL